MASDLRALAPSTPGSAHLLIHAAEDRRPRRGWLTHLLPWLREALRHGATRQRSPTGVRIDDLHGNRLFASEDTRSLIDVPLPAGTYHVDIRKGATRRRYTVTLVQGVDVDLYLRAAPGGR